MRIGIDLSSVVYGTGVSIYTKNLVEALLGLDKKNEYLFFFASLRRKLSESGINLQGKRASLRSFRIPPALLDGLWNRLHLYPIENFLGKIDIFHSSDWTQPPAKKAKLITTIHDLSFLRDPASVDPQVLAVQKRRLSWVKKEGVEIIAVSEATQKEITSLLGIPEKKIAVVYEALPADFQKLEPEVNLEKFKVSKPFIMAVGSAAPRKNIERIIEAFLLLKKEFDFQLVISGEYQPKAEKEKDVILTGFVSRSEYAGLLKKSQMLVYPSLYEGFGLPILEAFYLETPVVTSSLSSMREIAGQGAVLVDPYSKEAIAKAIKEVLKSEVLRRRLKKTGKKRLADFSWEKAARQTLKVYEKLKENGNR